MLSKLEDLIYFIDQIIYRYLEIAPFQRYPVELCVISLTFFLITLWIIGKQLNQDIATQLAIPLIKQFHDMGFSQNPGFNTLTHSTQRGYLELPSPLQSKQLKDQQGQSAQYLSAEQAWNFIWPESYSSYQLYATGHPNLNGIHCHITTMPRHDILSTLASLFGITPNKDTLTIRIAFENLDPFFWSFTCDQKLEDQIIDNVVDSKKSGKIDNICLTDDNDDGDDDGDTPTPDNSDSVDGGDDGNDSSSLFSSKHPLARKNNKPNKATNKIPKNTSNQHHQQRRNTKKKSPALPPGKIIDIVGLPLTNVLFCPKHVLISDTPELLHNKAMSPFPDEILHFLANLGKTTKNVFEFQSLTCTDQNDGYDVVNLRDIPIQSSSSSSVSTANPKSLISSLSTLSSPVDVSINNKINDDDIPKHEEAALLTLTLTFNSLNIPSSTTHTNDHINQTFVNECVDSICLQLFALSQLVATYQLPDFIHKRNNDQRENYEPSSTITAMVDEKVETSAQRQNHRLQRDGLSNRIIGTAGYQQKQQPNRGKDHSVKSD